MKAEDLVIGKIYIYTRQSSGKTFRARYLGVLTDGLFHGEHDFDPVDKGEYDGSIHSKDGLHKISEIEEGVE